MFIQFLYTRDALKYKMLLVVRPFVLFALKIINEDHSETERAGTVYPYHSPRTTIWCEH